VEFVKSDGLHSGEIRELLRNDVVMDSMATEMKADVGDSEDDEKGTHEHERGNKSWVPPKSQTNTKENMDKLTELEVAYHELLSPMSKSDIKKMSLLEECRKKIGNIVSHLEAMKTGSVDIDVNGSFEALLRSKIGECDVQRTDIREANNLNVTESSTFVSTVEKQSFLESFEEKRLFLSPYFSFLHVSVIRSDLEPILQNLDDGFREEIRKCDLYPSYFRSLKQFRDEGRENTRFDASLQMFSSVGVMVSTDEEYPNDTWNLGIEALDNLVQEARKKGQERSETGLIQLRQPKLDLIGLTMFLFGQTNFIYEELCLDIWTFSSFVCGQSCIHVRCSPKNVSPLK